MAKKSKYEGKYEGKDVLLEMIKERAFKEFDGSEIHSKNPKLAMDIWNYHCQTISKELYEQGLVTSAEVVLSHQAEYY